MREATTLLLIVFKLVNVLMVSLVESPDELVECLLCL